MIFNIKPKNVFSLLSRANGRGVVHSFAQLAEQPNNPQREHEIALLWEPDSQGDGTLTIFLRDDGTWRAELGGINFFASEVD